MKYREYYTSRKKNLDTFDKKFLEWMDRIEKDVEAKSGLGLLDLPDQNYMESFERGIDYETMVDEVLESALLL